MFRKILSGVTLPTVIEDEPRRFSIAPPMSDIHSYSVEATVGLYVHQPALSGMYFT